MTGIEAGGAPIDLGLDGETNVVKVQLRLLPSNRRSTGEVYHL